MVLDKRITTKFDGNIENEVQIPNKITTGRTVLCQKDLGKRNARDNYQSISYFLLMWKLMSGMF